MNIFIMHFEKEFSIEYSNMKSDQEKFYWIQTKEKLISTQLQWLKFLSLFQWVFGKFKEILGDDKIFERFAVLLSPQIRLIRFITIILSVSIF